MTKLRIFIQGVHKVFDPPPPPPPPPLYFPSFPIFQKMTTNDDFFLTNVNGSTIKTLLYR